MYPELLCLTDRRRNAIELQSLTLVYLVLMERELGSGRQYLP